MNNQHILQNNYYHFHYIVLQRLKSGLRELASHHVHKGERILATLHSSATSLKAPDC